MSWLCIAPLSSNKAFDFNVVFVVNILQWELKLSLPIPALLLPLLMNPIFHEDLQRF